MNNTRIDPRVRMLLVPIVGIATLLVTDKIAFMLLALGIGVVMYLSGVVKKTTKLLIIIASTCILQGVLESLQIPSLSILLVTILYVMQRLMLFTMLGASISETLTVGEVICTLEKLKFPKQVVVPIAVTLRFIPTIREEFGYIKESMRIRGIESDFKAMIRHPIRWGEYMLVPILMRSFKIADELSAAAMVRGIDRKGEKTLLYEFNWNAISSSILVLFIGYTITICVL